MEEEDNIPPEVADIALALVRSALRRGMEYEEFTFEIEGGNDDGEEYRVSVMKV
jgi:hypothetical protein